MIFSNGEAYAKFSLYEKAKVSDLNMVTKSVFHRKLHYHIGGDFCSFISLV